MNVQSHQGKIAGIALLLSILSIVVGIIIVATQGKLGGLAAAFRGVEGIGEASSGLGKAGVFMILLQMIGFGILTAVLRDAGEASISTVSFGFLILASTFSLFEVTFHADVTVWAGQQWALTGNVPELYETLRTWINVSIQQVYMLAYLSAMAGYGWVVLRTGILAPWIGSMSLAWSILWIVFAVVSGTLPAVIIVFPLIYGIGLLRR